MKTVSFKTFQKYSPTSIENSELFQQKVLKVLQGTIDCILIIYFL